MQGFDKKWQIQQKRLVLLLLSLHICYLSNDYESLYDYRQQTEENFIRTNTETSTQDVYKMCNS